ncbi:ATP-binding cassette domain-containing protein [Spiroplasma floricola]|uniref:ABC transporter ATP-binding protein n=1 Tax=Spiroplasma floricola 23-6 TaxID=1336749 RepID=A0A2K8SED9_9MOLU|nr:ABC transporter ATP-binding protein [Spiroplasma floricola]AUB31816.1 ABC transporter ATP-binding protein [Spiroplasma floricola 23-6]
MEVVLKNFVKKFKNNKIGPIDMTIESGKITAILGSSGSGKSVIINSIIGATRKFKGKILVKNVSRKKMTSYKVNKFVGLYSQTDFALYKIKAKDFLKTMCLIIGLPKSEIKEKIEYWLKFFDLWVARNKNICDFSWGMKNRLNLILCFIKDSQIIIMDEPGANLDSYWRNKIKNLLIEAKEAGKTVIITVHNIDEISDIIDDYIILDQGKKIFEGSAAELNVYSKYKLYVRKEFDVIKFKTFLQENGIKTFKYDDKENSLVIAVERYKQLNYLFLYLIKNNLPLANLIKLPINMEAICKALEYEFKVEDKIIVMKKVKVKKIDKKEEKKQ